MPLAMTVETKIDSLSPTRAWPLLASLTTPHGRRKSFFENARLTYAGARKRTFKRARFLLLAASRYRLHDVWFRLLESPAMQPMLARQPLLRAKIQHSYVLSGIGTADRLLLASEHFRAFLDRVPPAFGAMIYQGAGLPLAEIETPSARYALRLLHLPHCWQEGEMSLGLFENAMLIGSATLVLGTAHDFSPERPDEMALFVGGLQGLQGGDGQDAFRRATKAMQGLRPFSLLIHALRSLARSLGARHLLAVADAHHALRYKRAKRRIHLSYDDIWREHAATTTASGMFDLGTATEFKDLADISSHKRAQYRRRYAMMEAVDADITAALRHCG